MGGAKTHGGTHHGHHYRAISVLDQNQLNNNHAVNGNNAHFNGRHGSQSNGQRKSGT